MVETGQSALAGLVFKPSSSGGWRGPPDDGTSAKYRTSPNPLILWQTDNVTSGGYIADIDLSDRFTINPSQNRLDPRDVTGRTDRTPRYAEMPGNI